MRVPGVPTVQPLQRLSFSQYESGRHCLARLAWTSMRDRSMIPDKTGAILGSAFHAVIEKAHAGSLDAHGDPRTAARNAFDAEVQIRLIKAHPLLRLKFPQPTQFPFYSIRREQCAAIAEGVVRDQPARASRAPGHAQSPGGSERWLSSRDQLLFGRADYLDVATRTVVDYKSGFVRSADAEAITDSEQRQLRFYGNLALENGLSVVRGVIIRATGVAPELRFTPAEAQAEADAARAVLRSYNDAAAQGATFEALATPSMNACAYCDCISFCERFWSAAEPSWRQACGAHVEGVVQGTSTLNSMGAQLVQLRLTKTRGTADRGDATVEQVPTSWLQIGGASVPVVGQVTRAVDCRPVEQRPGVLRADKTTAAVWSL